jgi:hypothetical protein
MMIVSIARSDPVVHLRERECPRRRNRQPGNWLRLLKKGMTKTRPRLATYAGGYCAP